MPDSQDTAGGRRPAGAERPASPCVALCTLDDDAVCVGCGRSLDEIARWSLMSADEQWAVLDRLAYRQAESTAAATDDRRGRQ